MSRAWIAFYMGDYQKDTNSLTTLEHGAYFLLLNECWQHGQIPLEAHKRAAIAKMPLKEWKKIAPNIEPYFNDDGTNKRASKEIAKAEHVRLKRAIAGQIGGIKSGLSKAITKGKQSKYEANAYQLPKQTMKLQESSSEPNLNSKILNSSLVAAREEEKKEDGSLATALFESALHEPKEERKQEAISGPIAKPSLVASPELVASLRRRMQ